MRLSHFRFGCSSRGKLAFMIGLSASLAAIAASGADAVRATPVRAGIESLLAPENLASLQGKRLGVLAHQASRNAAGTHLVDLLAGRADFKLVEIFAPEHGLRGTADTGVPDYTDPATGLPVYSLYGPRSAPTPALLSRIDLLVIDLQDVGLRFYTYPATVAFTLKACAAAHVPVLLLDRPNPLGGAIVEGAVLEAALVHPTQPTVIAPLATRHGMTLGELALLLNESMNLQAELRVVPVTGWSRAQEWEDTGLPWLPPSPALLTPDQTRLYGSFGALEGLNLAVGRGLTNEEAFRVYGAPWITAAQSRSLVARLAAWSLPGLEFTPVDWTPTRREYVGQLCHGFRVQVLDRSRVEGFRSLIAVLEAMNDVLGAPLGLGKIDAALGARWLREAVAQGAAFEEIQRRVAADAVEFMALRARFLLY